MLQHFIVIISEFFFMFRELWIRHFNAYEYIVLHEKKRMALEIIDISIHFIGIILILWYFFVIIISKNIIESYHMKIFVRIYNNNLLCSFHIMRTTFEKESIQKETLNFFWDMSWRFNLRSPFISGAVCIF